MTNPLIIPLSMLGVALAIILLFKILKRILRQLIGLLIVGLVVWYIARLLLTAQIVIHVRPTDPAFYIACFVFMGLLWFGIQLVRGKPDR